MNIKQAAGIPIRVVAAGALIAATYLGIKFTKSGKVVGSHKIHFQWKHIKHYILTGV